MSTATVSIQLPELIAAYNRSVVRRAKAMAILAQRGHDLSDFLRVPDANE